MDYQRTHSRTVIMFDAGQMLRRAGFKYDIENRGTIVAHKGNSHYGFLLKNGRNYSRDAIERAIEDTE